MHLFLFSTFNFQQWEWKNKREKEHNILTTSQIIFLKKMTLCHIYWCGIKQIFSKQDAKSGCLSTSIKCIPRSKSKWDITAVKKEANSTYRTQETNQLSSFQNSKLILQSNPLFSFSTYKSCKRICVTKVKTLEGEGYSFLSIKTLT